MVVAQASELGQVALGRGEHAPRPLDRLADDGGHLVAPFGEEHGHGLDVVAGDVHHIGQKLAEPGPVVGDALG